MNKESIAALLIRYNSGVATEQDGLEIEQLLKSGDIQLEDLTDIGRMDQQVRRLQTPTPSPDLDVRFYEMLAKEKRNAAPFNLSRWFNTSLFWPSTVFAAVTFFLGIALGYVLIKPHDPDEIRALNKEVVELKEMMMLSLLEKESATDRLKAVGLSQEMASVSKSVTRALLSTLNADENVNVRLAALEALTPFAKDSLVRAELIKSISKQRSPLVQIALADLMAALQERSSVTEFKKLLEQETTPREVKDRIKERIDVMI